MGLRCQVISSELVRIKVTVDPALVTPDWLLWRKSIEADETNTTDTRRCRADP